MGIQGVEFVADTAVAQDAIRDAGFGFVVGHLGTGSAGQLTATRAQDYIAAGLSIVSVYDAPQQPLDGTPIGYDPGLFEDPASVLHGVVYRAGVIDGRSAYGLATSVGQAAGSAIYFEVDADVNAGIAYVLDYFRGIAEGFSQASMGQAGYKVGVFGSGYVLDSVYAADLADFKWLAAPAQWQGSAGYTTYDIVASGIADAATFPGAVVTHDMTSDAKPGGDFGQWGVSAAAANLVINDLTIRTVPFAAGGSATIAFAIGNAGNATAPSSTATLYLSSDATITAEDAVLGKFDLPSLAAKAATAESLAWAIPADLASGTYYIGIAAGAVPGESSSTDNAYAISFTVTGPAADSPNMVINDLSVGSAAVAAGGMQAIHFEVGNAGLAPTVASSATLYLSKDANITAADQFLGSFPIPVLAPNAALAKTLSAAIPAGTPVGTYYIGVVAGPVAGESNVNDNIFAASFAVTAEPPASPNLVINFLTLSASTVAVGGEQVIDLAVGNAGSAASGASTVSVYLSADANITGADMVLGTFVLAPLAPGAAAEVHHQATIPASLAAGTYHIGVLAAPVPGEPNVNDNAYAESFAVTRTPGSVSISDVTVSEGDDGTTMASFIVTRTGGTLAFEVGFATVDGGATIADGDYIATTGTLAFEENVVTRTITVAINGDLADEAAVLQNFYVDLSGATNDAVIADGQGQGTIADNDQRNHLPVITGRDARVHAGHSVSAGSLVMSVTDADGDAITQYAFRDPTDGGGFLRAGGIALPAGSWATVAAAELGTLAYVGGGEGSEAIELRAFDGIGWSAISQLSATTIAAIADDYDGAATSSGIIAVGGSSTGSIETPGDADWFAISLTAGLRYQFDLEGAATAEGTLADPLLELRDTSGNALEIARDDNSGSGSNARLTYLATSSGTMFLTARSADATTGSYKLGAVTLPSARLSIAALDANKPEGRHRGTPFTFTVTRQGDLGGATAASYIVSGSGAHPAVAADFVGGTFPAGRIDFAADQASLTISVNVADDAMVEDTDSFTVTLASLSPDAVIETATAGGLIKDDDAITDLVVINTATNQRVATDPRFYAGPVAGLEKELILITPDNVNATVSGDNWFIHTGSGTDALAAHGGRNVLDGGTGSNFLTGAAGEDTFFLDAREAVEAIWSTVVGFGRGDSVTVWGTTQQGATITWIDDLDAPGYQGLTMQASGLGRPNALVTLAGYSRADIDSGRLQVTFGAADAASLYLHILGVA